MAMAAAFSVSVDHTEIGRDHTFRLAARLEGSSDNFTLDATSLEKSFYMTAEHDTQKPGLWREKHYRLGAKRTGVLEVPALSMMFHGKKLVSQPFSVKVLDTDGEVDDVRLWVEDGVNHNHAWLHQQLAWHVAVLSTYPFVSTPHVHLPGFDGFDIRKVDAGVSGARVINGRRLFVMSWHVLLFPHRTGDLHIARPEVSAHVLRIVKTHRFAAGNPNFDAGEEREYSRKAIGSEQRIRVRALPVAAAHLPVGHLALSSDIPDTHAYAAEPLTWNIHLTGKGIRQNDMPKLKVRMPSGGAFTAVREKPLVSVRKDGQHISVNVLYRILVTPSYQGELHIPGVDMPFFNPDNGRVEHVSLAPRLLQVSPQRKISRNEDFSIADAGSTHRVRESEYSVPVWWKDLAIGMFILWLLTLAAWLFSSRTSWVGRHVFSRWHWARAPSLHRALAARDAMEQFAAIKNILGMPECMTPLGLLACVPDLRDEEILTWLDAMERGCWQGGELPPLLNRENVRLMVCVVQAAMHDKNDIASQASNPADFGRIGG